MLTNKNVEKIALGTVQFGLNYGVSNTSGKTPQNEVNSILTVARSEGISVLDTAFAYGNSEEALGSCAIDGFKIVSKFILTPDLASVNSILRSSLQKLNQTALYGYMAHHAKTIIDNPSCWEELIRLKELKLVKKIGYSVYLPEELEELLSLDIIPDIIQLPFNILDRRFKPYFRELKDKSVEIHTRSAFLQGLLLMGSKGLDSFFSPVKPVLLELEKLFPIVDQRAAALVFYCLKEDDIDNVVIGVNTKSQLERNMFYLRNNNCDIQEFTVNLPEAIILPNTWPNVQAR